MGTPLGHVFLRDTNCNLALEQRGDGIEFTLNMPKKECAVDRLEFKIRDDQIEELHAILHLYVTGKAYDPSTASAHQVATDNEI
jgi:hypothetical protein